MFCVSIFSGVLTKFKVKIFNLLISIFIDRKKTMDGVTKFKEFIHLHGNQLQSSGVPEHFWHSLCRKLEQQIFDAGDAFQLLLIDYGEDNEEKDDCDPMYTVAVTKSVGIKASDPQEIYIIDHAWTYRLSNARQQLRQVPGLLSRLVNMMGGGGDFNEDDNEKAIEFVMREMWRYNQMYALGTADNNSAEMTIEDRMPIWYIMDEFGSAINHSDDPNVRVVPFMHLPEGITYSLLFPVKDVLEGDQITRDYAEGLAAATATDPNVRNALLLPWRYTNFRDVDFTQHEPDTSYFLDGHIEESLPVATTASPKVDASRALRVFSQYSMVNEHLTSGQFEIVEREEEADILWLTTHFKTYKEFSELAPNKFINQFPFENVITIKDLLAIVSRRIAEASGKYCDGETLKTHPEWLPTTFNLKTELVKFVSYYQAREAKDFDNHWIIKPWNLARGLDTYICNDIAQIVRLQPTGPKIAQKYIENPVLFHRSDIDASVKFDVRYVFLLKSTDPLDVYIYTNFFLRFANKPFGLDHFDEYEKHFTVMNYGGENLQLMHLPCAEFLTQWSEQYPKHHWHNIERDICQMLRDVLIGATQCPPPCGIGKSPQSRALYAADIMLEWTTKDGSDVNGDGKYIQPKLLEINFLPDCQRACQYYPDFFNDIFKLLFLNVQNKSVLKKIDA